MLVQIEGVNLNEVPAWDGGASGNLPIGEYEFEVTAATVGLAKTGTKNLEFDLMVIAGAETDTVNGATKKHWVYLTDKSAGRVRSMLDACGVQMDANGAFDTDHFLGQHFIAEVYEDSFDKPNLSTGTTDTKITNKIRKERHVSVGFTGQGSVAEDVAPNVPAPRPAPAAAPTAPPARPLPPGPRVPGVAGSALPRPGQRAALPVRK
jgi:hypothetical protein